MPQCTAKPKIHYFSKGRMTVMSANTWRKVPPTTTPDGGRERKVSFLSLSLLDFDHDGEVGPEIFGRVGRGRFLLTLLFALTSQLE